MSYYLGMKIDLDLERRQVKLSGRLPAAFSSESSLSLKDLEAQIIEELEKNPFTTISALKKAVES